MRKERTFFICLILLVITVLFINSTVFAGEENTKTLGDFEYEIKSDNTITITDYIGTETNHLDIPSKIDGLTVTELGEQSFYGLQAETVTIPDTITTLDYGVFANSNLKSVTIPSSVTSMKTSVFYGAEKLETANINANIDILPNATFMRCFNLKEVTLSKAIKELDMQAFVYCRSLTDLSFLKTVETIGQQCFMYCTSLENVVLPSNIKSMKYNAFDSNVNVDLSNTRLVKFGNYYAIGTKVTISGTRDYNKAYEVLDLVNKERQANGLETLVMDEQLLEDAMIRAVETTLLFSHDRPTGLDCFSINDRMNGENIAAWYTTSVSVMDGWMNSPGHRANILTSGYKCMGVGCFYMEGLYYWVQCFSSEETEKEATKLNNVTSENEIYVGDNYINLTTSADYKQLKPNDTFDITIKNLGLSCNPQCAKWTSSDTNIATVDTNGKVTALKCGIVEINISLGLQKKVITIYVTPFSDVRKDSWYVSAVNYCYNNGIIRGTTDTTFSPETKLTRAMLVTILHRKEGEKYVSGVSKFQDVQDTSAYYYVAVKWATQNGIVSGYDNGNFGPNDPITREQLAVILNKYCSYKGKYKAVSADFTKFKDANAISEWAKWGMNWAVGSGVITGNSEEKTLNPQGTATRAEVASMLYKYCINVK